MTRMSNLTGRESPTRSICRSCSARSSWPAATATSPDFVDEQRAVVRELEAADARVDRAVNAPSRGRTVRPPRATRNGRRVERDERLIRRGLL